MTVALLSDIHANLIALEAVLGDLPEVAAIWVMGDTVGYGADPDACCDVVREQCQFAILGNASAPKHTAQPVLGVAVGILKSADMGVAVVGGDKQASPGRETPGVHVLKVIKLTNNVEHSAAGFVRNIFRVVEDARNCRRRNSGSLGDFPHGMGH